MLGILSAPAQASSWSSYLTGAAPGFESRRWTDDGGPTNIQFTDCKDDWNDKSVGVTLRKDTFGPDPSYTKANFTNCFGGGTSSGNWDGHGSGEYYFAVNYGLAGVHVWVDSLAVYY
ncbi:hypothetical protein ABZ456_06525 [Streptomyces sp. NPDC005776]|uniref:hypothetical protein n=1 Tax=Streptomyces sp. NPDC005776 TaxID=3154676 RepID=UPI0033D8ED96